MLTEGFTLQNVTPSCLAFLKSLDCPQGRDSLSAYALLEGSNDIFWKMTCRRYGWIAHTGSRIVLTPSGCAALAGGVTPMTHERYAFLRWFDTPQGRQQKDIYTYGPNADQQITWTVEFQIERWLTGSLSDSAFNDYEQLTPAGRAVLANTRGKSAIRIAAASMLSRFFAR